MDSGSRFGNHALLALRRDTESRKRVAIPERGGNDGFRIKKSRRDPPYGSPASATVTFSKALATRGRSHSQFSQRAKSPTGAGIYPNLAISEILMGGQPKSLKNPTVSTDDIPAQTSQFGYDFDDRNRVSTLGGPQVLRLGAMMGGMLPGGGGPGRPSAHALQHLNPHHGQMYQQQLQRQEAAAQQAMMAQQRNGDMPMNMRNGMDPQVSQAKFAAMQGIAPNMRPVVLPHHLQRQQQQAQLGLEQQQTQQHTHQAMMAQQYDSGVEDERDRRTVFVQQLAARLRTRELIAFFEKVGPVKEAQIVKDRVSGRSKGVGYVEFKNEESVPAAIHLTGKKLLGIPIIAQLTTLSIERSRYDPLIEVPTLPRNEILARPHTPILGKDLRQGGQHERTIATIRGNQIDVTDLGIDGKFLLDLPEDIQEEVVCATIAERRAQEAAASGEPSGLDQEFLDALPAEIREEIIEQERQDRRRREREEARRQAGESVEHILGSPNEPSTSNREHTSPISGSDANVNDTRGPLLSGGKSSLDNFSNEYNFPLQPSQWSESLSRPVEELKCKLWVKYTISQDMTTGDESRSKDRLRVIGNRRLQMMLR